MTKCRHCRRVIVQAKDGRWYHQYSVRYSCRHGKLAEPA